MMLEHRTECNSVERCRYYLLVPELLSDFEPKGLQ